MIKGLEKELEQCRGERYARVFGELIPIGQKFEEERSAVETMKWMSYSQHWIDNPARNDRRDDEIEKVEVQRINFSSVFLQKKRGCFLVFQVNLRTCSFAGQRRS